MAALVSVLVVCHTYCPWWAQQAFSLDQAYSEHYFYGKHAPGFQLENNLLVDAYEYDIGSMWPNFLHQTTCGLRVTVIWG